LLPQVFAWNFGSMTRASAIVALARDFGATQHKL
jgi:hypothetical protein